MPLYKSQQLKIYNSLSGEKEVFAPIHEGNVGMYVCGPTVYSNVHLGNLRTFMSFDVIFRYFQHLDYKVRYVRNITDVGHIVDDVDEGEDKIAKKARVEKLEPMEIVQRYTVDFHEILNLYNFLPPSIEPNATGISTRPPAVSCQLVSTIALTLGCHFLVRIVPTAIAVAPVAAAINRLTVSVAISLFHLALSCWVAKKPGNNFIKQPPLSALKGALTWHT